MEIQYDNTFNVCFASLWNTLKKFRIAFTICVFIVFFLVDLFITAISGMGSPTGNSGRSGREVALYLFPVLLFAGTVIASLAMWDAERPASQSKRIHGMVCAVAYLCVAAVSVHDIRHLFYGCFHCRPVQRVYSDRRVRLR